LPPLNNKICIISPSLKLGGIERVLVVLANYFSSKGHHVIFISCLAGTHFYSLDKNITLIEPVFKRSKSRFNKLVFYLRILKFIRSTVKKNQPDVVLAFGDWFSPLVLLALYGTSYPVYISDRTNPDYKFGFPIPLMKRWLYPRSAGFIAQTTRAAAYKQQQFGRKLNIKIIPNAIREVKRYDVPREKIILYVGRFAWEKAPERLIKAYAGLEERQGWTLLMAGSGPLLGQMQELVKELNIADEVTFPGKVEDVDLLYSKAGIYVLPSVLEGFPNALCEAMAAGLPVVCYVSIPWDEIIEPGMDGLLVNSNEPGELTLKLKELINNKELRKRLGQNARNIKDRLSVEKIGAQVSDFIFNK